jgi:formate dehydrogenase beta subunit
MEFDRLEWDAEAKKSTVLETIVIPCDDVILAIGQENAFPWIERDLGIEFDKWGMPLVDEKTFQSTRPGIFFGGDAAWGPKNIIWAVEHGHQAAISIDNYCQRARSRDRAPRLGHEPHQPEDGHQRVELSQRLQPVARARR